MAASTFVRARLALATIARDVADRARGVVGDVSTPMVPGERIRAARHIRLSTLNLVDLAVLAELSSGATWDQIADALGIDLPEAQRRYGMTWVQWQAGVTDDERDIAGDLDLEGTAAALDQWWRRHAEPWEVIDHGSPAAQVLVDGETAAGDR